MKNRLQIVIAYEKAKVALDELHAELEGYPVRRDVRTAMSYLQKVNQLDFVSIFETLQ